MIESVELFVTVPANPDPFFNVIVACRPGSEAPFFEQPPLTANPTTAAVTNNQRIWNYSTIVQDLSGSNRVIIFAFAAELAPRFFS